MPKALQIDFVSDVACPWCAVGLWSLEQALQALGDSVAVDVTFQPFELNPNMPPQGQDITEHLSEKYGSTPEQQAGMRQTLRERGAAVGFIFKAEGRDRVWNTFDAHRLLHWAGTQSSDLQRALKKTLLVTFFTDGKGLAAHDVLVQAAGQAGLDAARAAQILSTGEFAAEVRAAQQFWQAQGIQAVPSVVINKQHLIQGGQSPQVFEQALRQIAAETA
jgi:predicted DsbA family dithiol-disulfide isomerase